MSATETMEAIRRLFDKHLPKSAVERVGLTPKRVRELIENQPTNKKMEENITISIRIPVSLRDQIQSRADANYRSFSAEVRMVLEARLGGEAKEDEK